MHGIHIAAALLTVFILSTFGLKIAKGTQNADTKALGLAALIALPLQPLTYYLVRVPLDAWLSAHLDHSGLAYSAATTLYAPLTEEAAKLLPLLMPLILNDIRPQNFIRYAFAIGVAFAIGEVWFVADKIADVPKFAALPFYEFGGFATERLMTCLFHSAFVAITLWRLRNLPALGFLGAVALHWLGNFPVFLMKWNVGGLGQNTWSILIQLHLVLLLLITGGLLIWFGAGILTFYGRRKCSVCQIQYDPGIMAINLGRKRYERCPHCQKWHWSNPA
jgi:hypothetical protein